MVGFALAIAVVPLGLLGSRLIFLHLFVVAFVTWWLRRGSTSRWRGPSRRLPGRDPRYHGVGTCCRTTQHHGAALPFGVYGFWNLVAGQAGIFMPRVYDAAGFRSPAGQNALQVLVWGCTCSRDVVRVHALRRRMNRRNLYVIGAAMGIVAWALLAYADGSIRCCSVFAVVWGTSAGIGAQAFYSVWTSELFATRYRATAQGLLFFAARVAVGLLSYVFPTLLAAGRAFVGTLMLVFLLIALVVGAVWAPDTQGKSLREIESERYPEKHPCQHGPSLAGSRRAGDQLGLEETCWWWCLGSLPRQSSSSAGRTAELLAGAGARSVSGTAAAAANSMSS